MHVKFLLRIGSIVYILHALLSWGSILLATMLGMQSDQKMGQRASS